MGLSRVLKSFSFALFKWLCLFIMLTLNIAEAKIGECVFVMFFGAVYSLSLCVFSMMMARALVVNENSNGESQNTITFSP